MSRWDDNYDNDNRRKTARDYASERNINSLTSKVKTLEQELAKLKLATEAMWELCRDKLACSDTELLNKIKEVDLRDGKEDGKTTKTAAECPDCGRTISMKHKKCMYCNIIVDDGSIF